MKLTEIAGHFRLDSAAESFQVFGNGHINETYLVTSERGTKYIIQKVNQSVFTKPEQVMANILAVTEHIRRKNPDPRSTLSVIEANNGNCYFRTEDGDFWRVYDFISDSICLEAAESLRDFYESAVGFGTFQKMLSDFPADMLYETIPDFHNTADRYRKFRAAIETDALGRAASVRREIDFFLEREEDGCRLGELLEEGKIPLRVTHNDTKLNNVMLDAITRKALCVIDLDTVMPGLAVNDFGDSIRFGASTAAEDEQDLEKVWMDLNLYRTYAEGFLFACGESLSNTEIDNLALGAKTMTLECGMRFLTDYLAGDTYFRIHRPLQNLDRARTHIKLVSDMETKWDIMNAIPHELVGR